jgi:hypothetical protein
VASWAAFLSERPVDQAYHHVNRLSRSTALLALLQRQACSRPGPTADPHGGRMPRLAAAPAAGGVAAGTSYTSLRLWVCRLVPYLGLHRELPVAQQQSLARRPSTRRASSIATTATARPSPAMTGCDVHVVLSLYNLGQAQELRADV